MNQITVRERYVKDPDWINSFINGKEKSTILNPYNKITNKREARNGLDSV